MSELTLEQVRQRIREAGRHASPYRLGHSACQLGLEILCNPYTPGSRGYHSFLRGWYEYKDGKTPTGGDE